MNLKIKTSESSKKNSLKIAFLLYFLISVQFVFACGQTIDLNMTDKPLSGNIQIDRKTSRHLR